MRSYFHRLGVAFSIFVNVLLGGKSNQTFSATQHERMRNRKWHLCWLINFISRNDEHCMESWVKWKIIHTAINKNTKSYKNF
jgi:hypothetical protein